MDFYKLLILQFIGHVLADFFFQSDKDAKEKNGFGFKSKYLKWHLLVIFIFSWVLSFQITFIVGSIFITLMHWLIDGIKMELQKVSMIEKYTFFIDQIFHIIVIYVATFYSTEYLKINPILNIEISTHYLIIILGYLLCAKPSNVFIKEIIKMFNISSDKKEPSNNELPNAGKLIGIVERWLVLTFILLNHFEPVGFLIAAKSILRFKDDDTLRTEYVVVGTMLSFGLAIGLGILIILLD